VAWQIDPKIADDPWFMEDLNRETQALFTFLLICPLRTTLPGLYKNISVAIVADTWKQPIAEVQPIFQRLLEPCSEGRRHVLYDARARVLRIPSAPKWNHGPGDKILAAWFRCWCAVPDCDLKWDHLDGIRDAVNLHNPKVAARWQTTFEPLFARRATGLRSVRPIDLRALTNAVRTPTERSPNTDNGHAAGPTLISELSPSYNHSIPTGHERRSNGVPIPLDQDLDQEEDQDLDQDQDPRRSNAVRTAFPERSKILNLSNSSEPEGKEPRNGNGRVSKDDRAAFGGSDGDTLDPESHPSTASPERRRQFELAGWKLSPIGIWLPPGTY
jgi:hypothetical protein